VCLKLHKKQAQRSAHKCNNLSKISPERRVFEKTGVEIQQKNCSGHSDMAPHRPGAMPARVPEIA
jgi:hypothetical protein